MKMSWQPQEEGLRQIIQLLKESQSADTAIQRAVQQVSFFFDTKNCPWSTKSILSLDKHFQHNLFTIACFLHRNILESEKVSFLGNTWAFSVLNIYIRESQKCKHIFLNKVFRKWKNSTNTQILTIIWYLYWPNWHLRVSKLSLVRIRFLMIEASYDFPFFYVHLGRSTIRIC